MSTTPIIFEENNKPLTTSRDVAEYFGKQHDKVIRDIEKLKDNAKIGGISEINFFNKNFFLSSYSDSMSRKQGFYIMTKDGFTLLAMGFTGAKAY